MSSDIVIVERDNRIAVITLNRPERLNAISREIIAQVKTAMDQIERDDEIAVVIIRGAGRAFSSKTKPTAMRTVLLRCFSLMKVTCASIKARVGEVTQPQA